ncbi:MULTISPECIES: YdaS family helix-turn-helix protein [unclassified Paraburkholderia]|uniref:YdaS family helix-turn-helix protein n=1 Tax=unclassified Paraburkholderia TaxID=2615204 RepID=UPI001620DAAA|nr:MULTISPECIES: YdaS family helix-turn-helix protein [unclassified Paraburkholderia]
MATATQLIRLLGGPTAVARLLDIRPPSVTAWKTSGINPGRVAELAIATGRIVKSKADLRPDRWHEIWPELIDTPSSPTPQPTAREVA